MRTASATFNRETGHFTLVVSGNGSKPAKRATAEQPSALHEGVASVIRPHLTSDTAIREAYLQIGKSYYGEDPLITVTIFVDTEATMFENERAFNWIQSKCDDQRVYFDLWTFNDLDLERLDITGDKLIATGHSLIYTRDA